MPGLVPADQAVTVVAAQDDVVGDVEILRAAYCGVTADAHVLDAAVPHREAFAARHVLQPGEESDVGVADRESLENVVVGGHDVEEPVAAVPVENDLAIARRPDDDGLLRAFPSR